MSSNTHQEKNYDLGNKIRNFRLRAGLSQFKLEELIDASPGSVSRIENGEVNPSKETLLKIINVFELKDFEALDLFSIRLNSIIELLELMVNLSDEKDAAKILQTAVNSISNIMGYRNVSIFLIKDNIMNLTVMNNNSDSTNAIKMAADDYKTLSTSIQNPDNNLAVRAAVYGEIHESSNLLDFVRSGPISEDLAKKIQKITNLNNAIALPLGLEQLSFGCLFVAKITSEPFEDEIKVLQLLARHIGIALRNSIALSQKYKSQSL